MTIEFVADSSFIDALTQVANETAAVISTMTLPEIKPMAKESPLVIAPVI